jgi:hypothetical protein
MSCQTAEKNHSFGGYTGSSDEAIIIWFGSLGTDNYNKRMSGEKMREDRNLRRHDEDYSYPYIADGVDGGIQG